MQRPHNAIFELAHSQFMNHTNHIMGLRAIGLEKMRVRRNPFWLKSVWTKGGVGGGGGVGGIFC